MSSCLVGDRRTGARFPSKGRQIAPISTMLRRELGPVQAEPEADNKLSPSADVHNTHTYMCSQLSLLHVVTVEPLPYRQV
jgi:hypothetical protein